MRQQIAEAQARLLSVGSDVVETEEIPLPQEAGIYNYAHQLESAVR